MLRAQEPDSEYESMVLVIDEVPASDSYRKSFKLMCTTDIQNEGEDSKTKPKPIRWHGYWV